MISNPLKLKNIQDNLRTLFIRPEKSRFEFVDGLRALSILWVIAFHCYFILGYLVLTPEEFGSLKSASWVYRFLSHGSLGVDVFFAISGFLIGFFIFDEFNKTKTIKVKDFYIKRIFRLLPVYIIALILWALLRPDNFHNVWTNILYINNFLDIQDQHMGWSWSLAIEEQFYTIFPWFALLLLNKSKHPLRWMGLLFVISFFIRYALVKYFGLQFPYDNPFGERKDEFLVFFNEIYIKPYTRYGSILIGVITSYLYLNTNFIDRINQSKKWRGSLLGFGITVFFFFTVIVSLPERGPSQSQLSMDIFVSSFRNIISLATCTLILYAFSNSGKQSLLSRFMNNRFWYPIAQLSYSAYLFHFMVIVVLYKAQNLETHFSFERFLWNIPLSLLLTGIVSMIFFIFIEMPFIRGRSKFLSK